MIYCERSETYLTEWSCTEEVRMDNVRMIYARMTLGDIFPFICKQSLNFIIFNLFQLIEQKQIYPYCSGKVFQISMLVYPTLKKGYAIAVAIELDTFMFTIFL